MSVHMIQQHQNIYPMKEWHLENMKKTVVKYVTGLSESDTSSFQKRHHKKYAGNLGHVRRSIDIDIRHGVTREEVLAFLNKVRNDRKFSSTRDKEGSMERLDLIEAHFTTPIVSR
jgi:hypothetical protein